MTSSEENKTTLIPLIQENTPPKLKTLKFDQLGLNKDLVASIEKAKWTEATPVQTLCLPYTLKKRDVAGFAQTGTGKTGVFLITFAHLFLESEKTNSKSPFAVVIAPTRELALQIEEDAKDLFKSLNFKTIAIFGGVDYDKQIKAIKSGVNLIVATPGRLKDFIQKKVISLKETQLFICDEVDRMFDMGFIDDVEFFLSQLPEKTQKLIFSATTNEKVKELAFEYLENPEYISVNPEVIAPESLVQHAILCELKDKLKVTIGLINEHKPNRAIIFTNTKLVANWLQYKLAGNGIPSDIITGDLPQRKRIALVQKIKRGEIKILIATDVASRGIHISGVTHVYNFDLPDDPANYIHRIGRTARAGSEGASFSLVCDEYGENFDKIKEMLKGAAPEAEWYDPKYLDIKDKAGNPFDDNFGKPNESRERPQRKDAKDSRGNKAKPAARKPSKQTKSQNTKRPQKSQNTKKPQHQKPRRDNNKQMKKQDVAVAAVPQSTGGLIKRVFSVLFGKKNK